MRERDPQPPEGQDYSPLAGTWFAAAESPIFAHRIGLRLTLGATGLVVLIILVARAAGAAVPLWLVLGIAITVVVFTRVQERLIGEGRYQPWMPLAHMVAALVLLSIGITYTGGVQSPFVWVYALSMAVEGILRGPPAALLSATVSTILLVTSTILVQVGAVPFTGVRWSVQTAAAFLVSYIGMFYAVALVLSSMRFQIRQISRLALTDPLTGLGNRRAMRDQLNREIQRASRYNTQLAVAVVDLDGFKDINDRHGHLRADDLLRQLSVALRRSSRDSDFPARFGGDEFVLILPQTSRAEAARVAERIRTSIEDVSLLEGMTLTASIGVASFPRDAMDGQGLLDAADRAMYRVKGAGGNRVGVV